MNVTGWSALSLWTISLGLGICFLFFTKIKIYLLKMKIVCFFLAAGVQTKECPSTYWAHAFEFGENIRLFTKAPINEANFYYFTCLKWVSDHKLTCNRPRAICLGSLNRIQQSALSIDSLSCCCIAVSHGRNGYWSSISNAYLVPP